MGVIGVYVILGLAIYWPLWPWTSTRLLGVGADPVLATWFLAWVPHALTHAANPLFSDALYAPLGINVAQNTSSPLLGVLTGLLAPLLSPVQRGNLVMILALPASASATYLVLRRWKVWAPAAAIGGLVYGFSPFEVGHAVGQLSLMFLPLPPLIAYTLVAIVAGRGSPIRRGLQLSILLAAQFLISAEIFVMCIVLLAVVLGSLALLHPAQAVHQFQRIFKPLAAAAILTGLIIAIPVWMVVFGPRHFSGPGHPVPSIYHTDLLSFLHPGWFQRYPLGISPLNLVGPTENTGYIGVPLLIVAVVLAWRSRRAVRTQVALLLTGWAYLLSLGNHLSVEGHLTRIPLPFAAVIRIPFFDNMLPGRFSFATSLGLAAVVAFGLDDLRSSLRSGLPGRQPAFRNAWWARLGSSVACVVALMALVVSQAPRWPLHPMPARGLPPQIVAAIPKGDPVAVTYPYPSWMNAEPLVWQMQDGFSFRLMGGYTFQPDADGRASLVPNLTNPPDLAGYLEKLEQNIDSPPTDSLTTATRAALANDDVRFVMVDQAAPGGVLAQTLFERALGRPNVRSGSISLWNKAQ